MVSRQLFKGHAKFKNVYDTRTQLGLPDCVSTWDAAYDEEYDGLDSLPTWEVISETRYRQLSKGRRALPTMAIR